MSDVLKLAACANIPPRLAGIVAYHSLKANIDLKTLRSDCRRGELVRVRQRIAWEARRSGYSLWQIGRAINRDHNTVLYSIKTEASKRAASAGDLG